MTASTRTAVLNGLLASLIGLILFIVIEARTSLRNYWLLHDGREGIAIITRKLPKYFIEYRYTINQQEFIGEGRRDSSILYQNLRVGDKAPVFYSAMHPEYSSLSRPRAVVEDLPVLVSFLVLVFLLELYSIHTKGKWPVWWRNDVHSWVFRLADGRTIKASLDVRDGVYPDIDPATTISGGTGRSCDGPLAICPDGAAAVIRFGNHEVRIEKERVLVDSKPRAEILASAKSVEVVICDKTIRVEVDNATTLTTEIA